jgi:hypothetical protein
MRMLNPDGEKGLKQVQLYLSTAEARELCAELGKLLQQPETADHFHLFSQDGHCELSCSIVTRATLAGPGYTPAERRVFGSWHPGS